MEEVYQVVSKNTNVYVMVKHFTEEIVQYLMKQIVDAIRYIHSQRIIHRDLKLENIMVSFNNDYDKII